MYADYLKERLGKILVQKATGFFIVSYRGDALYLEDIYIKPEFRHTGEAQRFSDECYQMALKLKLKFLIGSVNIDAKGAEYSARIILENGFKFHEMDEKENMIYFKKPVRPMDGR